MKKIIISIILLSAGLLLANPIALVFISEIYFERDDWTIELYDYYEAGISSLDNCCIMSSSDSTYFNNGIYFEPGEIILVTEEDLQSSLSINKGGDFVLIFGNDFDDLVQFGDYAYSNVNSPYEGQSLARVVFDDGPYDSDFFLLAKENQPSLGSNPFSVNTHGILNGYVFDINNNPVNNANIFYFPSSYMCNIIDINENGYFENMYMYGMNYSLQVKINGITFADTTITIEPDSTTFIEFYTNYNPNSADNIMSLHVYSISNYPNPFNPSTSISFDLTAKNAKVEIYNSRGQKVDELSVHNNQSSITWNADNFPSGVYLYKLIIDGKEVDSNKMLLLK